ncbi:hypothetical protein ACHAPJ_006310 [Fusarium lateritium]
MSLSLIPWRTIIRRDAVESGVHRYMRRDKVVPAECYDDCDGTYKIAQSVGKSDALCREGSSFRGSWEICETCLSKSTDGGQIEDYIEPKFKQFLDFCNAEASEPLEPPITSTVNDGTTMTSTTSIEVTTESEPCTTCQVLVFTDQSDRVVSYTLGPNKEALTASLARTVSVYVTLVPTSVPSNDDDKPGPDIATIVGPVVPSVVVLILISLFGFLWYRRHQKKRRLRVDETGDEEKSKIDKPQLHSDCIRAPTYELEGSTPDGPKPTTDAATEAEMAANEVAAHEVSADQKKSYVIP